jgi:hypothetical protein
VPSAVKLLPLIMKPWRIVDSFRPSAITARASVPVMIVGLAGSAYTKLLGV